MSTATQFAIAMPVIAGLLALTIDLGWTEVGLAELHVGADAAALAGASALGRGDNAYYAAKSVARKNLVAGAPIDVSPADVTIGTWDGVDFTLDPEGDTVRVITRRLGYPAFLGALYGRPSYELGAEAYASVHPDNTWPCLMFAERSFVMNGAGHVFGYDSSTGLPEQGSMCSNATAVEMKGSYRLDGDFHPGRGGSVTVSGAASMTGDSSPMASSFTLDRTSMPSTGPSLPASIKTTTTLSSGNYVRRGDLSISSKGQIVISSSPVDIYIDGDLDISGIGFVNTTRDPHALTIHVIGAHDVNINGSADFYGAIDAPDSSVKLNGTSAFYGAVAASDIEHTGTGDVYLDSSLADDLDLVVPGSGWGCALLVR